MSPTAELRGGLDASDLRIAVAVAEFNASITDGLLKGALDLLEEAGATDVLVARVAGAFELPVVAADLVASGCDAVIALGAVILGETDHYEHVATQCAAGLRQVAVSTGVPVAFGVLTTRSPAQARERSEPGPGNKGAEAAEAAVRTADLLRRLRESQGTSDTP